MRRANERARQRVHPFFVMPVRIRLQLLHRLAHFKRRRTRRHRFPETHRHRVRNRSRHLPQESPALETENTAPHAIEIHGHDRRIHALHDAFHSAPEGKQLPDARNLPFGKNANHFARADRVARLAQRLQHLARPQLRRNRNRANHLRARLHKRQIVNPLVHQKSNRPVRRREQQQRIHQRHMIRHEKRPARLRNILAPLHANPVNRMRHHPQHQPQKRIRQQVDGINRHHRRKDRAIQENSPRCLVQPACEQVIGTCRQKYANE